MKYINTEKYGIIHAFAQCSNCTWDSAIKIGENNRMSKLRARIVSHIKNTGHEVILETGNSTKFYLSKADE